MNRPPGGKHRPRTPVNCFLPSTKLSLEERLPKLTIPFSLPRTYHLLRGMGKEENEGMKGLQWSEPWEQAATRRTKLTGLHISPQPGPVQSLTSARTPHQAGDVDPHQPRKLLRDGFFLIFLLLETRHSTAPPRGTKAKTSPIIQNLVMGNL